MEGLICLFISLPSSVSTALLVYVQFWEKIIIQVFVSCLLLCRRWAATSGTSRSTRRRRSPTSSTWWRAARAAWTRKATAAANRWTRPPEGAAEQAFIAPTKERKTWTPLTARPRFVPPLRDHVTNSPGQSAEAEKAPGRRGALHFLLTPKTKLARSTMLCCISSSSAKDCRGPEAALLAEARTAGPTTSCCNLCCRYVQKTASFCGEMYGISALRVKKTTFSFFSLLPIWLLAHSRRGALMPNRKCAGMFCFVSHEWASVWKLKLKGTLWSCRDAFKDLWATGVAADLTSSFVTSSSLVQL